jgi:tRNA threonylcarbamoyladenosine biosynthesis protein TsaB
MPGPNASGAKRRAPLVLAFDTASSACSVAIGHGDEVLAYERREMRHGHAEALLPMIDRVTATAGLVPHDIDIVAATVGPGGFTGIRAGLAAAHGLALAAGATLLGVTSFAAVAEAIAVTGARLLVALDSRREDFYVQLFDEFREPLSEPAAILPSELAAWVGDEEIIIAGDAAEAAAALLSECPRIQVLLNSAPDARGVLAALRRWPDRADVLARPLYLRAPDVSFPPAHRTDSRGCGRSAGGSASRLFSG